ncbi:MAG: Crp/Fnr family transcriptional regulator [Fusicatenibacter sp.]|nr:Crp/Fnr family transcriptional regulator [Fusicatenibacter sp.]
METLTRILKKSILFCDLPEDVIEKKIIPYGQTKHLPKGTLVISLHEQVTHLGVVISGKIQVEHIFTDGTFTIMDVLSSPEILGADLVFTRTQISPYYAISEAVSCIFFLPVSLLQKSGILPEAYRLVILNRFLTLISNENIRKEYRLTILSRKGIRDRILTYLSMQAYKQSNNTILIPFSREELAAFLCVNRSALSHELSLMQQEGLIRFHKNKFTLLQYFPLTASDPNATMHRNHDRPLNRQE